MNASSIYYIRHIPHKTMDTASYKSLLRKTRKAFSCDTAELVASIDSLLKDCKICIDQSLGVLILLLSETEVSVSKLIEYIKDAISLLDLLCNAIKNITETWPKTSSVMKTAPASIGSILSKVFVHCKESEDAYGDNLTHVQTELKNLFKSCHEVQSAYLIMLEKHVIFNKSDKEGKRLLLEAVDVNLRIIETVHSLDVKSLAAQWKIVIVYYEKYTPMLANTDVFPDAMAVLCVLFKDNIKFLIMAYGQDKLVTRALKICNFFLKTLLKICGIFDLSATKEYDYIIYIMFHIYEVSVDPHLQTATNRAQFVTLVETPTEYLLKKLLRHETFAKALLAYNIELVIEDGLIVGYIVTLTFLMACLIQGQHVHKCVTKSALIACLYNILSKCGSWNLDAKMCSGPRQKSRSVLEHMLVYSLALASSLDAAEYALLEKRMLSAILSTHHNIALFSCQMWVGLHASGQPNHQLLFKQIVWLCTLYKKLDKQKSFQRLPQNTQLSHTICRLFKLMENDDKRKICKQFRIHDEDNMSLWSVLSVSSLPREERAAGETVAIERLAASFLCFDTGITSNDIKQLVIVMKFAATCTFADDSKIAYYVIRAWSKTCHKHQFIVEDVNVHTFWYHDYLRALLELTEIIWHHLARDDFLDKLLHCVTSMIEKCNVDLMLLFVNIMCMLANTELCERARDDLAAAFSLLHRAAREEDSLLRHKLFLTIKQHSNKNLENILAKADKDLYENWNRLKNEPNNIKRQTDEVILKQIHKCTLSKAIDSAILEAGMKKNVRKSNIFFLDSLEDIDVEESAAKKVKPDDGVEDIVKRLETDAALLRVANDGISVEHKKRIQNVCNELSHIMM